MPNFSFEILSQCPYPGGDISVSTPWKTPNLGTPDLWHAGCLGSFGPPNIILSGHNLYQFPHTGVSFIGVGLFTINSSLREYISVNLSEPLISGKKYYVEFFLSLTNASIYAIEDIGLYFDTTESPFDPTLYNLPFEPQIRNTPGVLLSDTLNWMKVSGIYEATGNEKSIIIGNFKPDSLTNFQIVNPAGGLSSYYWIDDVYVGEYIPKPEPEFSLSPNPGNGDVVFNYHLGLHESAVFRLYNSIGQLVAVKGIDTQTGTVQFQFPYLQSGVYYWQVVSGGEVLGANKWVVNR